MPEPEISKPVDTEKQKHAPHILAEHVETRTIVEKVVLHARPERGPDSAEFARNKRRLVRLLDLPCWICKSRDHREVHHIHEHAQWDDLDPALVLDTLHAFDPYGFTHQHGDEPITTPDDIRNLLVLCGHCQIEDVEVPGGHHRGKDAGIHEVTMPTLFAIRAAKPGVQITMPLGKEDRPHKTEGK